jgi:hypothetical protein
MSLSNHLAALPATSSPAPSPAVAAFCQKYATNPLTRAKPLPLKEYVECVRVGWNLPTTSVHNFAAKASPFLNPTVIVIAIIVCLLLFAKRRLKPKAA